MKQSRQRGWLTDLLEAVPSIVFLTLWRSGVDIYSAGWIGVILASVLLLRFRWRGLRFNPIMLGVNAHLVVITPLIVCASTLGANGISNFILAHSYHGVLVSVFVMGCILTVFAPRGFIGVDGLSAKARWAYSIVLLFASALTVLWAFQYTGSGLFAVTMPMVALFALRRFLVAKAQNGMQGSGLPFIAAGVAVTAGPDVEIA